MLFNFFYYFCDMLIRDIEIGKSVLIKLKQLATTGKWNSYTEKDTYTINLIIQRILKENIKKKNGIDFHLFKIRPNIQMLFFLKLRIRRYFRKKKQLNELNARLRGLI